MENKMELKVKRLTDSAKLPQKAHIGDLGYDIFADESKVIESGDFKLISTGIAINCPNNNYGFIIKDRSSMACKGLFTHAGVIDAGYTGEIKVLFHNSVSSTDVIIEKGDKIAQLIPTKVIGFDIQEVSELHNTKRGNNGFGSTGI
jgi:dUTP pyrophosphatase